MYPTFTGWRAANALCILVRPTKIRQPPASSSPPAGTFSGIVMDEVPRSRRRDGHYTRLRAGGDTNLIGYDGGHWNAAGHRLVAQIVQEQSPRDSIGTVGS